MDYDLEFADQTLPVKIPLPLIVTGIAGVCGYNAFRHFSTLYPGQGFGIRRQDYWPLSGDGILGINSDNTDFLVLPDQGKHPDFDPIK